MGRFLALAAVLLAPPPLLFAQAQAGNVAAVDYDRDVRPILSERCFGCHGERQQQSGLRLDLRQSALRGGDYGVVIVPGNAAESKLIKRLIGSEVGLQMPPTGPIPQHEIETLRTWINVGAEMPGRQIETVAVERETSPAVQPLIDAIVNHDLGRLKTLLAADKTLAKAADGSGSSLLMHGAASGTVPIMQALIDAGADVNAKNSRAATALHWAAADAAKVKLLLLNGASVNARTVEGRIPLFAAATMPGSAPAMRHLLEAGADVNAATLAGTTPLFPAVNASVETTRLLLDHGADPNRATRAGVTPILFTRDAAVVSLLVARGADVRARSKVGETALMDVAARGDLAAAKLLLGRGADVNAVDHRGYTALVLAAHFDGDAVGLVQLLLAAGADPHAIAEGQTALSLAERRGETEVTEVLRAAAAAQRPSVSRQ
jgi:ankyrin repeat protein